ncbi:MAG: hypothetical protein ACLP8S_19675 [Solirubrobacteraceae bacterium]
MEYLRYLSPPRPWSYDAWGAWAAPLLARRLGGLRREFPFADGPALTPQPPNHEPPSQTAQ